MYMAEQKTYTEEEMQKIVTATQVKNFWLAYGKQWFLESLSHTESLVRQGAFPQEAHQVGRMCFEQFMANTGITAAPSKKEEELKPDE
jgi:hypothetical protein